MNDFVQRYGPWAIVAGATEGTGAAFARRLARLGLNCILIARREGPLESVAAQIRATSGVECLTASIDLSATDATERIVAAVGDREVGLFVANAGADPYGARFLDRDVGTWVAHVQRGILTTMQCCHHFATRMQARTRGGLLLVGSGACYGGASFMAAYSGTKAFELCFGESLWCELREHGVDVLYLALTATDTPALRTLLKDRGTPLPERLADPDEIARVALERLPHGPVFNWGQADDDAGYAPTSAAARRARALAIGRISQSMFGSG